MRGAFITIAVESLFLDTKRPFCGARAEDLRLNLVYLHNTGKGELKGSL